MKTKLKKMKPAIKRLWVKALRSGKYKQTSGKLHEATPLDRGSFCCLGVLCDLAIKRGVIKRFHGDKELTPETVQRWAGIDPDPIISIDLYGDVTEATTANDTLEWSFKKIARAIEKNL